MQHFKLAKLLVFILQDLAMIALDFEGETGFALRPHADMIPCKQRRKCVQLEQSSCKVEPEYRPQSHSRGNGILQSLPCFPTPLQKAWSLCLLTIRSWPQGIAYSWLPQLRPCGTDGAMKTLEVLAYTTAITLSHIPTASGDCQDKNWWNWGIEGTGRTNLGYGLRGRGIC